MVLLTGSECRAYPGTTCVMETLGPYTQKEAMAVFAEQPEWACPHLTVLHRELAEDRTPRRKPWLPGRRFRD